MTTVESDLHPDILSDPLIVVYPIMQAPRFLKTKNKWVFLVFGPLKVVFQIWSLWVVLGYRTKPAKWMLVQVSDKENDKLRAAKQINLLGIDNCARRPLLIFLPF